MIKGINRNVIEINNLKSEYFERAIVVLKDSCTGIDENEIQREASLTLDHTCPEYLKRRALKIRLQMLASGVLGAFISAVFITALYLFV